MYLPDGRGNETEPCTWVSKVDSRKRLDALAREIRDHGRKGRIPRRIVDPVPVSARHTASQKREGEGGGAKKKKKGKKSGRRSKNKKKKKRKERRSQLTEFALPVIFKKKKSRNKENKEEEKETKLLDGRRDTELHQSDLPTSPQSCGHEAPPSPAATQPGWGTQERPRERRPDAR
jgi:hypothetical protein